MNEIQTELNGEVAINNIENQPEGTVENQGKYERELIKEEIFRETQQMLRRYPAEPIL